ncbi:Glucose 1-dehydrogenase 2 [Symmachiella dynata]|uniref:SDR family NAD(P)-dependent oxidoreductase n=1 Tax=Symmachiella dynata TaxID=2527995 RepID=UPI0011898FB7|nr:SDR family oxidoreductase [Symmachiella dynata]QDT47793.1 Glucose 1-dehydrogenase 2 [Symmachiella dynata]
MGRLDGKTAIVTGGGAGIGRATSERFAAEGANVIIAEINEANGAETAEAITAAGGQCRFVSTDVTDEETIKNMVAQTISTFGRIDIVVNNAAVFVLHGIEATVEQWHQSLNTNVIGTSLVSKYAVEEMRKTGGGSIVNLGSISSFLGQPNFVTYNATKAAIATMTRCMALDLADDGIRVNAVCPGTIWTQIVEKNTAEVGLDRAAADADPDWGGACFLKRIADPSEVAAAILFFASDDASYCTGAHLMVDGGYSAQ